MQIQLLHYLHPVAYHRLQADKQLVRYLLAGEPLRYELEHFAFPGGKLVVRFGLRLGPVHLYDRSGCRGIQVGVSAVYRADGGNQLGAEGPLGHVSGGAGLYCGKDVFPVVMLRQHDDLGGRVPFNNPAGRFQPVEARHCYIHHHHVRGFLPRLLHRLLAV